MDTQQATWIGVALSVIALFGTIANNVVSYFKDRDKLKYDRKVIELEGHVEKCNEQHEETKVELAECKESHLESTARHDETERRLAALEQKGK